ncbi:hypothetical protein [Streptomyces morookaense]|uniref:Uncharacterized protein n=1 Tax=Streptomyces morookaense TaxID=1970 RepID=A0A7Y7B4R2_STRMO|nr:hypothetical protein [Streptomyces morookaense]NVK78973.1 hypothetical protein [Streptomyces morookaense]GHF36463.1 hypothetical protein GCM10010359_44150 [Streptomyces morookaense]
MSDDRRLINSHGREACPKGSYALYANVDFNGAGNARIVLADQQIDSLNGYHSSADITSSVVNNTDHVLELFIDADQRGRPVTVAPGQALTNMPQGFNDTVSSTRLRPATTDTGNGKSTSNKAGGVRDAAYTATGATVDRGKSAASPKTRSEWSHWTGVNGPCPAGRSRPTPHSPGYGRRSSTASPI